MTLRKAYLLIFILLLVDQVSKIYIKTNFILGKKLKYLIGSKSCSSKMKEWLGSSNSGRTVNYFNSFRIAAVGGMGIGCGIQ
jgi:signal peptidase II